MQLVEPLRWENLLQMLNAWVSTSQLRFTITSFLADFFVFLYPILLVVLYIIGIKKKSRPLKIYALYVFFSACVAALLNIVIQAFVTKARPESVLTWADNLLLKHLPTMSFPSDHAAVSMAIAIALICATIYVIVKYSQKSEQSFKNFLHNRKIFVTIGVLFLLASIVMSIARVAVGVHWPTDILAWWIIGWFVPYLLLLLPEKCFLRVVSIEEWIMRKLGIVKGK